MNPFASPNAATREAVAHLDAPFSVLDLDAALANARDMAQRAMIRGRQVPIRLASKSLRIPQLMSRVLAEPGFHGILAFHLEEAMWLAEQKISDDILVAYPCANRESIRRWTSDTSLAAIITCMVDSVEHLDFIDSVLPPAQRAEVRVCIDVDASLKVGPAHIGALRSPLHSVEQVLTVAREVINRCGFRLVGLMAYEGQIAGTTDTSPAISAMKSLSTRELAKRRAKVVAAVQRELGSAGEVGIQGGLEFVNGGGTGSIETTGSESCITEIGAGSGILGPALFDNYKTFTPQAAQWFVLPVVRRPAPDTVTVAGGGRIASGPAGNDRRPSVDWPRGLAFAPLEGPGEVQTPLSGRAARNLELGDHVWFRHAKAGEQAEFTDSVWVVSDGRIVDQWRTYRGEGRSFV